MESESPFPYERPETLRRPTVDALTRVVDPEVAMSIVDVGLIYGVTVTDDRLHVVLTATSAACPVTDVLVEEVETELVWQPPRPKPQRLHFVFAVAGVPEDVSAYPGKSPSPPGSRATIDWSRSTRAARR
jgi:metal-sulfur cluster biosynthetic enzyme